VPFALANALRALRSALEYESGTNVESGTFWTASPDWLAVLLPSAP
jgi:hypothetical protein